MCRTPFWNAGKTPARIIEIIAPAGFEKYFEELPALFAHGGPPDHKRHTELRAKYGEYPVEDWAPQLLAKYQSAAPVPLVGARP
jgi:hypothetical protein